MAHSRVFRVEGNCFEFRCLLAIWTFFTGFHLEFDKEDGFIHISVFLFYLAISPLFADLFWERQHNNHGARDKRIFCISILDMLCRGIRGSNVVHNNVVENRAVQNTVVQNSVVQN